METNIYRNALQHTSCAFAYNEAVFDKNGNMIDYIIIDVNQAFEEITGLKRKNIINKKYVKDVAKGAEYAKRWVEIYERAFNEERPIDFEDNSNNLTHNYTVRAFREESNRFITVFNNMTFQKKMQEIGQYFINNIGSEIDFDRITEYARDVSGAEYAAFNLLGENEKEFTTVSAIGISKTIKKALAMLGFDLVGKKWAYDPRKDKKTKEQIITFFDRLQDLSEDVIPEGVISRLVNNFNIGNVVVAKIIKEEKVLGDFTLIFKKGHSLRNQDLLILYLSQLGLFIEKNRLDNALRANQRMFYTLPEFAPFGFLSCNTEGDITYANKRLVEIMDSPSLEATKAINLIRAPRLVESGFSDKLLKCIAENQVIVYEMEYNSIWERHSWLRVHFTPYRDNTSVIGANIIIEDITQKRKKEEELLDRANRDPLTRAYNRNALDTILLERLAESRKNSLVGAIAAVDIDDFKTINDTFGHGVGDSVLMHLAARIKQELREDDLVVRTGGDEFLFYLHNINNKEGATKYVEKIFREISEPYYFEDTYNKEDISLDLSCSIGISIFPEDGKTVEALMSRADEALYKIKKNGKGAYGFA